MLSTALEIIHYFSRVELEGLQMQSRFLRDLVDRNSSTLPLRYIHEISPHYEATMRVCLERDNINEETLFQVPELTGSNLGLLFDRINNAFVERFETSFTCDSDGVRFIRHLRDRAAELKCRIKILDIEDPVDVDNVDFALVDLIACRLQPQELHDVIWEAHHTTQRTLFDHLSMRSALRHLRLYIDDVESTAKNGVIAGLLNVGTLQTCVFARTAMLFVGSSASQRRALH